MKTLNTRRKLIALVLFVAIAILSIGNKTAVVPAQNRAAGGAANEGGIWIGAGITQGQSIRFNNTWIAGQGAPGPENAFRLTVFDSQGNVVVQQTWTTNPNQTFYFDLNADQLPQSSFNNNGRAELIGLLTHPGDVNAGGIPGGGCVVAGEVFDNNTRQTLIHITGTPISECRKGK